MRFVEPARQNGGSVHLQNLAQLFAQMIQCVARLNHDRSVKVKATIKHQLGTILLIGAVLGLGFKDFKIVWHKRSPK